ncbi:CPBP family intramembrane glutamic endopeptidase [Inconstantimicrobium mannanitabidum]|uniref:CAAX amino protease n=1 Tax=Inconstantimicrobium mannanitabidum TaxID=1604901 RepID=A0ACB5RFU5_9CLOT|nr:CPBP family intramembrane glutamic endopeptidase [Clostridium sp. TW13]GKX67960.1 CAAX amino protease [Clostridium sp. TW13]
MKKLGEFIVTVILLPALYFFISAIGGIVFMFGYALANNEKSSHIVVDSLQEVVNRNISLILLVVNTIMLVVLFIFCIPTKASLLKRCNFKKCSIKKVLYTSLLVVGVAMLTAVFVGLATNIFFSYKNVSNTIESSTTTVFQFFIVIVLAPIFEEIFFRGVIFYWLKNNFNIVFAIIVQALVFAIMHGNILQGIYTFFLGIILALINMYTGSLYGNIAGHCVFNLFGTLIIPSFLAKINFVAYIIIALALICVSIFAVVRLRKLETISVNVGMYI